MNEITIPLFPLHTVLFPGGPLPLRIFEPRYQDMVSTCLRNESGFGVCLIRTGREVGEAADTHEVGTFGRITYWHRRPDGLLGITITGEQRFRILEREVLPSKLIMARVQLLENEPEVALPAEQAALAQLLRGIMEKLEQPWIKLPKAYEDASWVSGRLVELLPLKLSEKQALLQLDDPLERLRRLQGLIRDL